MATRTRLCLTLAAGACALLLTETAAAEVTVRPAAAGMVLFEDGEVAGGGYGNVTLGYNLEMEPLLLMPELAAGFGGYGGGFGGIMARVLGGLRGGVTGPVEPALFVRGGYGVNSITRNDEVEPDHGLAIEAGLGLDYRPDRDLTYGAEIFYDALIFSAGQGVDTVHTLGLAATVAFWL